jgi:hypothetical protein
LTFTKYYLCLILTKNFLTLLKPLGEMFAKEALARENICGFVHSFRKTRTSEDLTIQETLASVPSSDYRGGNLCTR